MKIPIYQVDAFSSEIFSGNPAAVCILDSWIDDHKLQSIAAENNLSETAFITGKGNEFELRWFTPATEVDLCGHATLASAFVLNHFYDLKEEIRFSTKRSGILTVKEQNGLFEMDFPSRPPYEIPMFEELGDALGKNPRAVYGSSEDLLAVFDTGNEIREMVPDQLLLMRLDYRGIIVTAKGENSDFVSRYFGPQVGVPEDPVTGSAHCVLAPYWSKKLGKKNLHALQVSNRGGELFLVHEGDRVKISGRAALYMEGYIYL